MDAMVIAVAWGKGNYYTIHVTEVEDTVATRRG
jgi:hypothetical protein